MCQLWGEIELRYLCKQVGLLVGGSGDKEKGAKLCRRGWGHGDWRKKMIEDGGNIGSGRAKSLMAATEESLER